jgi:uncharacterized protein YecT (DUF1311 family)
MLTLIFCLLTCIASAEQSNIELRLVSARGAEALGKPIPAWPGGETTTVQGMPYFTRKDFDSIEAGRGGDDGKTPVLRLRFKAKAAARLQELTTRPTMKGHGLAVVIGGRVAPAPKVLSPITQPITTGMLEITGPSEQDLREMARVAGEPDPVFRRSGVSPSFDCDKAANDTDRLICANKELALADRKLSLLYRPLLRCMTGADNAELKSSQRKWLATREACLTSLPDSAEPGRAIPCIAKAFETRIAELSGLGGEVCSGSKASASKPGFTTFRENRYGFELTIPKGLKPTWDFVGHYHVSSHLWRQGFEGADEGTGFLAVGFVAYRPNGDQKYPDVEVRVGLRPGKTFEEACGSVPTDATNKREVELGGRKFQVSELDNAGMSQYIHGESYRTFSNGYCYAIERFVTDTSSIPDSQEEDEANARRKKQADAVTMSHYEETKAMAESFRLFNP